jgi:hypothetical protein
MSFQTNKENNISCPNCGTSIDVQDILSHQLEEEIQKKYQNQIAEVEKKFEVVASKFNEAKEAFEKAKKQEKDLLQECFEKQINHAA